MSAVRITGVRFTHVERHPDGIRVGMTGHLVPPLPDLATASLAALREAEWSGREPCKIGDGAWMTCQCCGAAKIDGKGHKPGCAMAAALAARAVGTRGRKTGSMSDIKWQDISECPDDFERSGGQRTWRLLLRPDVVPGKVYGLRGPNAVPTPRQTTGRRAYFNNSGWVEANTNREVWPTHFAPLAE